MKLASVEAVVRALNDAGVAFIVVGGLAVAAHGYGRSTQDVDLVIRLDPENVRRAFDSLAALGTHPAFPSLRTDLLTDGLPRTQLLLASTDLRMLFAPVT